MPHLHAYTTRSTMPQSMAVTVTATLFTLAVISFWYLVIHREGGSLWIAFGVPTVLVLAALPMLFKSLDDNYYHVTSGIVVAQKFTPAHSVAPIIPGFWTEDDWALKVRDAQGHEGWIHFLNDPFTVFPVGSHFPQ